MVGRHELRIGMLKNKIVTAIAIVGLSMFAGEAHGFSPAHGVAQAQPTISPGCIQVNNPIYDGVYWDTGNIGQNGFGGPFNPGEMIIVSANPPIDYATPWRIYIFTIPPDGIAVQSSFPGTVSYIIPSSSILISWGASGGGATWTAQCVVPSSIHIPLVMKGNP
jgi:hypothetical protein